MTARKAKKVRIHGNENDINHFDSDISNNTKVEISILNFCRADISDGFLSGVQVFCDFFSVFNLLECVC